MAELVVHADAELPASLRCQVLSFVRITWPEGFRGPNRQRDWITDPAMHPRHFTYVEGGLVVSHAEVVWTDLSHAGERFRVYGLTGVLTYPQFRGEGHGGRVVEAATRYIDETEADVAIVNCAPALTRFYAGRGWQPMPTTRTLVGPPEAPVVSDEALLMRFLSEKGRRWRASFEGAGFYIGQGVW